MQPVIGAKGISEGADVCLPTCKPAVCRALQWVWQLNCMRTFVNNEKQPPVLVTPYIRGINGKIEKKCKHLNIRTSKRTQRRELVRVKNRVKPTYMKGVVYKID